MESLFRINNIREIQHQEILLSITKLFGVFGSIYFIFALLIFLLEAPLYLIIIKSVIGVLLWCLFFLRIQHWPLNVGILLFIFLEVTFFVVLTVDKFPESIFWILLAPNYIFLLQGKFVKFLFLSFAFLSILFIVKITNDLNLEFEVSGESLLFTLFFITTICSVLLINSIIIQQSFCILKRHNQELNAKNKELKKTRNELINSQNFREKIFASVSHEIRTPISIICGAVDILKTEIQNQELTDCLQTSCDSLSILVNDFLEFKNINSGEILFENKPIRLKEKMQKISSVYHFQLKEKNLEFQLEIDDKIPNYIDADEKRLIQILLNIIGNGINNTHNGKIKLEIVPQKINKNNILIKFLISCLGKLNNTKPQNPSDYYDVNIHSILNMEWTKKIIASNNGTFRQDKISESLQRYEVIFDFDISDYKLQTPIKPKFNSIMNLDELKILIVDDNLINLSISKKQILLHQKQYQIDTAQDGFIAIEKCSDQKFDVILLDIRMPKISGIEVAKILRKDQVNPNFETPIIALTADITEKTVNECKNAGMNSVVSKPYNIHELLKEMKKMTHEKI